MEQDLGRVPSEPGSREPSPQAVSAASGFDPSRGGEYVVDLITDRPSSGQWHCGPNAAWVTVTHLPTMISARAFDQSHHRARQAAQACCEMMVEQSRLLKCQFPERLWTRDNDGNSQEPTQ